MERRHNSPPQSPRSEAPAGKTAQTPPATSAKPGHLRAKQAKRVSQPPPRPFAHHPNVSFPSPPQPRQRKAGRKRSERRSGPTGFLPFMRDAVEGIRTRSRTPVRRAVRIARMRPQKRQKKGGEVNLAAKGRRRQFPAQNGDHPSLKLRLTSPEVKLQICFS